MFSWITTKHLTEGQKFWRIFYALLLRRFYYSFLYLLHNIPQTNKTKQCFLRPRPRIITNTIKSYVEMRKKNQIDGLYDYENRTIPKCTKLMDYVLTKTTEVFHGFHTKFRTCQTTGASLSVYNTTFSETMFKTMVDIVRLYCSNHKVLRCWN